MPCRCASKTVVAVNSTVTNNVVTYSSCECDRLRCRCGVVDMSGKAGRCRSCGFDLHWKAPSK